MNYSEEYINLIHTNSKLLLSEKEKLTGMQILFNNIKLLIQEQENKFKNQLLTIQSLTWDKYILEVLKNEYNNLSLTFISSKIKNNILTIILKNTEENKTYKLQLTCIFKNENNCTIYYITNKKHKFTCLSYNCLITI